MRVLITGGTGFVGRATVRALLEAGHAVRVFARDENRARDILGSLPVEIAVGDLGAMSDVAVALDGRDALIHAGAAYRYDKAAEAESKANPRLSESALGAALQVGVRVVDVSSQVVFALGLDSIDPTTPLVEPGDPGWRDPYLRSKVQAEEAARLLDGNGLDRVTVHPALVIGPDDPGPGTSGGLLVRVIGGGTLPDFRIAVVDVRDVAAILVAALGAPRGAHYLATGAVVRYRDLAARIDTLTGRRVRRFFMPPRAMRGIARLNDLAGGHLVDLVPSGSLDYLLGNARVVDTSRTTGELGIAFRPIEETLVDMIRWWADHAVIEAKLAGALATRAREG
ncbi:MAG TPA: NAD-dependent epimerase/dehydratase family protein [Candidatus Limnocylindrales bacterium]